MHAGTYVLAVGVGVGQLGDHEVALDQRVVEGVDVDGEAVRVLRPGRLAAGRPAHVAGRGVPVSGRRGLEVGRRRQPHLLDGEVGREKLPEDLHHVVGDARRDDQLTGVRGAVEAAEDQGQVAQVGQTDGAGLGPGRAHPCPHLGGDS